LNHPNIVSVHDVGTHDGAPYVVTELLHGETLRERLAKGPVPLSSALDWAVQIAKGLAAAHEHGIVHRDLKPENVFLTRSGEIKLLDFGIAKALAAVPESRGLLEPTLSPAGSVTSTGVVLGTPGYMSPEQLRGEAVDGRSDIFSVGAIFYELLSGERPFRTGTVVETSYAILHEDPPPLPPSVPAPNGLWLNARKLPENCGFFQPAPEWRGPWTLLASSVLGVAPSFETESVLPCSPSPMARSCRAFTSSSSKEGSFEPSHRHSSSSRPLERFPRTSGGSPFVLPMESSRLIPSTAVSRCEPWSWVLATE
jgi:serine/threonine protein kinase